MMGGPRIVILGRGGHALGMASCFQAGQDVLMVGLDEEAEITKHDLLCVGIGVGIDIGVPLDRIAMFEKWGRERFANAIHPSAVAKAWHYTENRGLTIMAGAIIQPRVEFGDNVLINTGAQVDHDCIIRDHTVIAPGAILCGEVIIGKRCAIGAGAIIVQRVELPDETRVPAGTLVVGPDDFRKPVRLVPIRKMEAQPGKEGR